MHYHGSPWTSINPLTEYQFSVIEWCEHTMRSAFSVFFHPPRTRPPLPIRTYPTYTAWMGPFMPFACASPFIASIWIHRCIYFYSYPKMYNTWVLNISIKIIRSVREPENSLRFFWNLFNTRQSMLYRLPISCKMLILYTMLKTLWLRHCVTISIKTKFTWRLIIAVSNRFFDYCLVHRWINAHSLDRRWCVSFV